ncbi:MAG: hypothetical protein ABI619_02025, partial [Betaproteobacteria bacterium]
MLYMQLKRLFSRRGFRLQLSNQQSGNSHAAMLRQEGNIDYQQEFAGAVDGQPPRLDAVQDNHVVARLGILFFVVSALRFEL